MSRTFILASAAAVLIALTGASAQAGAIVEAPSKVLTKEVAKLLHAAKPAAKPTADFVVGVAIELTKGDIKQAKRDEAARKRAGGSTVWKMPDGEQTGAATLPRP